MNFYKRLSDLEHSKSIDQAWLATIKEMIKEESLLLKLQTTDDQQYLAELETTINQLASLKNLQTCQ